MKKFAMFFHDLLFLLVRIIAIFKKSPVIPIIEYLQSAFTSLTLLYFGIKKTTNNKRVYFKVVLKDGEHDQNSWPVPGEV